MAQKMKQIKINVTESDYYKIAELAKNENLSMAKYFRTFLDFSIKHERKRKEPIPKINYKKCDPELLYQITGIARNINQITRTWNTEKILEIAKLNAIYKKVMSLK